MWGGAALLVAAFSAACDVGGPDPEDDAPALRVVAIDVTTRVVDADGASTYASTPLALDGTTRPTTGTSIRVRLNRFLDPATATRQAICVQSAALDVASFADCTAGLLLRPSYDPVTRTVTYFLETDTTQLAPDTFYRVTLFRSEGDGFGLRAYDGPALGGPFVLEFTTESARPDDPAPTDGPELAINYCNEAQCRAVCSTRAEAERPACSATCDRPAVETILGDSCAFGGCHAFGKDEEGSDLPVAMGLDMLAAEGLEATAIARVAHGAQRGPGAQNPDSSASHFGRAMAIIAPGDPGNSYLLYKVLANPAFAHDALEPGETDRLRSAVVVGAPMPPTAPAIQGTPAFNRPLTPENAQILSQWIAAGADTSRCGTPPVAAP